MKGDGNGHLQRRIMNGQGEASRDKEFRNPAVATPETNHEERQGETSGDKEPRNPAMATHRDTSKE